MPPRLSVPANVNYGNPLGDGRTYADAAERNANPIAAVIADFAPYHGSALELASGTGQHITNFAPLRPDMVWQPTDGNPKRLASINAWVEIEEVSNVVPARELDATEPGWSKIYHSNALVLIINLLHLVSEEEAQTILHEAAESLLPGGRIILYGPFLRDNRATSNGDWIFDAELQEADPDIGYKDDGTVVDWLNEEGLLVEAPINMPANNLCFVATRPGESNETRDG